jgi:uncharacterized membrane protein YtjA (UPF0391 family)
MAGETLMNVGILFVILFIIFVILFLTSGKTVKNPKTNVDEKTYSTTYLVLSVVFCVLGFICISFASELARTSR